MCDYSLEVYGSRPAREGERLVTTRFPSGTIGLAAPGAPSTPVCMACDTRLAVEGIPADMAARYGIPAKSDAIFMRLDSGAYRDGLKFSNGVELSLQQLPPGVSVSVTGLLEVPLPIGGRVSALV